MNKALFAYIVLAALALAVFAIWPELDLAGARYFYHGGGFFGRNDFERFGRDFFRVTPFVVLVAYAALWLAKRLGARLRWAPSGRAMIFLIATMIIGPGLIVNLGFKDHWHRPRPVQTQDFNGPSPFMPWYDDNGGCKKNCSFVSGEAATGFWMVAPASVLPPPWRAPAMVAAFAFGFGASLCGWPSAATTSATCCSAGSSRSSSSRSSAGSSGHEARPSRTCPAARDPAARDARTRPGRLAG